MSRRPLDVDTSQITDDFNMPLLTICFATVLILQSLTLTVSNRTSTQYKRSRFQTTTRTSPLARSPRLTHVWKKFMVHAYDHWYTICDKGWVPFGVNCYWFSKESSTFKDAQIHCDNMTSTLLEIGGSWEERWIHMRSLLQGYKRVWLGITDFLIDGVFLSASTASRVYYTSWKSGQPDGGQLESCGMFEPAEGAWSKHIRLMPKNGTWSDTSCDGQLEFVCEKKGSRRWRPMCPRYKKILKLFP